MENIIQIRGVTKKYRNKKALDNLSLDIKKGGVIGILGPNGSGKTTLIKILTGLLRSSSGEVLIDGQTPGPYTKSIVSYLPDRNFLYDWMTVDEAIRFYKDFYEDFDREKAINLIEFMDLKLDMRIKELSKGMHEKLNLSLVLARRAKVYIIDEPIAGVDPVARDQILDAIVKNYDEESTMIITTHLVRDMESLFDDVAFLRDGTIDLIGNAESLREERGMQIDDLYKEIFG
nr:ABC transporter ATP-binding protein [Tissierella sp.]